MVDATTGAPVSNDMRTDLDDILENFEPQQRQQQDWKANCPIKVKGSVAVADGKLEQTKRVRAHEKQSDGKRKGMEQQLKITLNGDVEKVKSSMTKRFKDTVGDDALVSPAVPAQSDQKKRSQSVTTGLRGAGFIVESCSSTLVLAAEVGFVS